MEEKGILLKSILGMACHTPPLKNWNKIREMPLQNPQSPESLHIHAFSWSPLPGLLKSNCSYNIPAKACTMPLILLVKEFKSCLKEEKRR